MTLKLMNKWYTLSSGGDYKTRNKGYPTHTGMDYTNNDVDTSVLAVGNGKVIKVIDDVLDSEHGLKSTDYPAGRTGGNEVHIQYDNCENRLCHLKHNSIKVTVGDVVKIGDIIGTMGNTGYSSGMHLHFEIRVNNIPVDPLPYINEEVKLNIDNSVKTYTVSRGDSLWGIAERYFGVGTKYKDIMRYNNLKNTEIYPGQILLLTEVKEESEYYEVKKGDSLWAIAEKFYGKGSEYHNIVKLNNLKNNIIYSGQKLRIR